MFDLPLEWTDCNANSHLTFLLQLSSTCLFPTQNARPTKGSASFSDDRLLHSIECAPAIEFPRQNPIRASSSAACSFILLCDRCRCRARPTFLFSRRWEGDKLASLVVKPAWIQIVSLGGCIQPAGNCRGRCISNIWCFQERLCR